jgi:hypothetical protein
MSSNWIPIVAAIVGAAVGVILTYVFTNLRRKRDIGIETAIRMLSYLAKVLNRSAPEIQAKNAKILKHEWDEHARELFLVSVQEQDRTRLDERMVAYLKALELLHEKKETRDEVERLRDLAKTEAHSFLKKLGLSVKW